MSKQEPPITPTPSQAPEFKSPLDMAFEAEEAEVAKILNENPTQTSEGTVAEVSEETPPPTEPEPEPAPVQEPTETPPEPLQTEKTPPTEPPERDKNPWRELREMRRQLAEEKRRREELEAKITAPPPDEQTYEEPSPLDEIAKRQEAIEKQLQQNAAQERQRQVLDTIRTSEAMFSREHEDYTDAITYLAKTQRDEYEISKALDNLADKFQQDHVQNVEAHFDGGTDMLTGKNFQSERDAAKDLAFRVLLDNDRSRFVNSVLARGENIAEASYQFAKTRGWRSKADTPPPPTAPPAQQRVQQAAKAQAVSQSLSAMQTTGNRSPQKISTREQLMSLDADEREALILEMDQKQPGWDRELG